MEVSTSMMQHILRMSEKFADVLTELKQVKKELAELKGEKLEKPKYYKTKYPHMSVLAK